MLTSQKYGRLLEPGLRKIFFDNYKEKAQQYNKIFNVQDSDKAIETDFRMGGFGLFDRKESAGAIRYQDPTGTQAMQYIAEEYASGFTVERKLVKYNMYNQINKMPKALARSARATVETTAATIFKSAFTTAGFDGQPLISNSHVALNKKNTINNRLATAFGAGAADGALSDRNLKAAMLQASSQVNDSGLLIQCVPKLLVVPPALYYKAKTILGGDKISAAGDGTTNTTDINALESLQIVKWDYISAAQGGSDTAWFLIDPEVAELNFFWHDRLSFENTEDFDTMQAKYRAHMAYSVGYSDFRGVVGSAGTGAA